MTAFALVAKQKAPNGKTLQYPATTAYKQWVWSQIKKRKWALQDLVNEMKRIDRTQTTLTTSTLSQFLGSEDDLSPSPSNSSLLPLINRVFKIPPPPVCDPGDDLAQLRDRFAARWRRLSAREQQAILSLLGDDSD